MLPEISVVCPCFNEEANVEAIAAAVIGELERVDATFEYIFIDNASSDRTVEIVKRMCARDPRIKLIANTRNFGQMRSPTHCIYQTTGRAVLGIASDFQDPPELIPTFIARWREGWPIVLGVREAEPSSLWLAAGRALGYGLLKRFGDVPTIPGATGFGIYDQKVVEVLKQWNEPEPFFRAMLVASGFPIFTVPHRRGLRLRGQSSNTFLPMLDFAISGLTASAMRVLRVPMFLGLASLAVAAVALVAGLIVLALAGSASAFFWTALIEANFGVLLLFVGLMGDQIRLISERTRHAPLVVEKERVNFAPPAE